MKGQDLYDAPHGNRLRDPRAGRSVPWTGRWLVRPLVVNCTTSSCVARQG